ncbi:unnamed protein product [Wickerhamomyces anomalus]
MPSKNVPSLENLVNQCCENYYSKLNESVADELNISKQNSKESQDSEGDKYYSYSKFQEFISASHCQENLKFLIEIYHYEKIWNRTFKRQSSILKCKDDEAMNFPPSNSRKQSVATIRTMNSRRSNRHPSIMEETPLQLISPVPSNKQDEQTSSLSTTEDDPISPVTAPTESDHGLSHNDLDKLVQELSLPKILKSGDDIDTNSFLNQDLANHGAYETPRTRRSISQASTSPTKKSTEIWDSLFKPSYICENDAECACHTKNPIIDDHSENSDEFNEAIEQQEVLEHLKEELREKFEFIISNHVVNNSPEQINLPDTVYSNLMKEYENNKILYHSPLTLLPSKNVVLQLLRENIYYNFLVDQENLINKENSHKIIKKMDEMKISNTPSSSTLPTIQTINTTKSKELKVQPPKPISVRSNSSDESLKSKTNTPISTISNFLNKYHIKIHHSNSSSSLVTQLTDNSSSNSSSSQAPSPISKSLPTKSSTFSSSTSSPGTPSTSTSTSRSDKFQHKHYSHSSKYVKGPCGIEPNMADYDPHPPTEKSHHHAWARMTSKFKHKK